MRTLLMLCLSLLAGTTFAGATPRSVEEPGFDVRLCGRLTIEGDHLIMWSYFAHDEKPTLIAEFHGGVNDLFDETISYQFGQAMQVVQTARPGQTVVGCAHSDRFPYVSDSGAAVFRAKRVHAEVYRQR